MHAQIVETDENLNMQSPLQGLPLEFVTGVKTGNFDLEVSSTESLASDNYSYDERELRVKFSESSDDLISFDEDLISQNDISDAGIFDMSSSSLPFTPQPSLSLTYDLESCEIISDVSNDEQLINIDTTAEDRLPLCLPRIIYPNCDNFSENFLKKFKKRPSIITFESTTASSTTTADILSSMSQRSSYSRRVQEIKTKLRAIEIQNNHQRRKSLKYSTTETINTDNSSDSYHKLLSSRRSQKRKSVSMTQIMMEAAWEIICFNTILCAAYMIFMFYSDLLSIAAQGNNILSSIENEL